MNTPDASQASGSAGSSSVSVASAFSEVVRGLGPRVDLDPVDQQRVSWTLPQEDSPADGRRVRPRVAVSSDEVSRAVVASTSTGSFRLHCKCFLLTFPQCDVPPRACLLKISEKWEDALSYVVVAREHHLDGTLHLHACLRFKQRHDVRNAAYFDFLVGKHGNYRRVKEGPGHEARVLRYVAKEGDYVSSPSSFHLDTYVKTIAASGRNGLLAEIVQQLSTGRSVVELSADEAFSSFVLMHSSSIRRFQGLLEMSRLLPSEQWQLVCDQEFLSMLSRLPTISVPDQFVLRIKALNLLIHRWLSLNVQQERPIRTRNLYIAAPPGHGKTTFIHFLMKSLKVLVWSTLEKFCDLYDNSHDVLVFDEFRGQVPITLMNSIGDGSVCVIPGKGFQSLRTKNTPVIILSNLCMYRQYQDDPQALRDAFCDRFVYADFLSVGEGVDLNYAGVQFSWFGGKLEWFDFSKRVTDRLSVEQCTQDLS